VVFFARYEASRLGSSFIETEHLLLGLLRENKEFAKWLPQSFASVASIRKQIEESTSGGEQLPVSVDMPLSNECKRILAYAAEEAERLSHRNVGTEHLFLGILREKKSFAATILREHGVSLESARERLSEYKTAEDAAPLASKSTPELVTPPEDRSLEPVIAERTLELVKLNAQVIVKIGMPRKSNGKFITPYQIIGLGDANVRLAAGVDAVQALQLALSLIGAELKNSDLRWARGLDSGFPTS
jgi:ATP-dependent Clp protease ATP-binding subunit ClpA